jgi:hypothetical protein
VKKIGRLRINRAVLIFVFTYRTDIYIHTCKNIYIYLNGILFITDLQGIINLNGGNNFLERHGRESRHNWIYLEYPGWGLWSVAIEV